MSTVIKNDQIQLLQAMPVFGGIRADILRFLVHLAKYVSVREGEFFYDEGDPANSLFILESGEVTLLKHWEGYYYKLKSLQRGDCFGQVALIDLQPRNTSALAMSACSAMELSADDLHQLYEKELEQFTLIHMNMAREVCRRLREADFRAFEADLQARRIVRGEPEE